MNSDSSINAPSLQDSIQGIVAIVDDDPNIGRALGAWLDLHGLRATQHTSAESLLKSLHSVGERLGVTIGVSDPLSFPLTGAVLDLNLPGRSGIELAHALRQRVPDLPVVIITALRDDERAAYGPPPAGVQCLRKPFDLDALEQALFPEIHTA